MPLIIENASLEIIFGFTSSFSAIASLDDSLFVPVEGGGTAVIWVNPTTADFYQKDIGSVSSGPVSITIANIGNTSLTFPAGVTLSGPDAEHFYLNSTQLGQSLAPGAFAQVTVHFTPKSRGVRVAEMHIGSNDTNSPDAAVFLRGVCASPILEYWPPLLNFEVVPMVDPITTLSVTLKNAGVETLEFTTAPLFSGPEYFFAEAPELSPLEPASSRTMVVGFEPLIAGHVPGQLNFYTNDKVEANHTLPLSGMGAEPNLVVKPMALNFGNKVLTETSPTVQSIVMVTDGAMRTVFGDPALEISGPDADCFRVVSGDKPAITERIYAVHEALIAFSPTGTGTKSALLKIISNDPDSPEQFVSLTGNGVEALSSVYEGPYNGHGPGRSTIGTGGDYPSLAAAAGAISNMPLTGGDWEFIILNDLAEVQDCRIGQPNTNGHSITFRPAPGTSPTITFTTSVGGTQQDSAGHILIGVRPVSQSTSLGLQYQATSNIVIDGSATVEGSDRSLTFRNLADTAGKTLVHIAGNCDQITIKNCRFENRSKGTSGYLGTSGIELSSITSGVPPSAMGTPDNISIVNNELTTLGTTWGTGLAVNTDTRYLNSPHVPNRNIIIRNNTIHTQSAGVDVRQVADVLVTSNTIDLHTDLQISTSNGRAGVRCAHHNGMLAQGKMDAVINGNVIRFIADEPIASLSYGVEVRGRFTGSKFLITNNMISGLTGAVTNYDSYNRFGIWHSSDFPSTATIVHNSIGFTDVPSAGISYPGKVAGIFNGLPYGGGYAGLAIIRNNIVRIGAPGGAAIATLSSYNLIRSQDNVFYTTNTAIMAYWNSTSYATLSDWQAASQQDTSSVFADPFTSANVSGTGLWIGPGDAWNPDMHFSAFPGNPFQVPAWPEVAYDIDNEVRPGPMVIPGADEVAPASASVVEWKHYQNAY